MLTDGRVAHAPDAAICAALHRIGHRPGTHLTADEVRALVADVRQQCIAAVAVVRDRYRPHQDGRTDTQAQIARNAAETCIRALETAQ